MLWSRRGLLLMALLLLALTLGVAFANGANDVSKGIATLAGAGVTDVRGALRWGAAWTVAGGVAAAAAAQGLVAVFSASGLLARETADSALLVAVAVGTLGWLVIATRSGLPVSTTHALLGALVGGGITAAGLAGVRWEAVGAHLALPLAASPLVSLALMVVVLPRIARINAMDSLHWLTAGFTSFARGLNDTPKILALGVAAAAATGLPTPWLFALVAMAMGAGSYWWGRRVTQTLATRVTRIAPDNGFAANLVTSTLVALASTLALPVSTTHVATGAIVGAGLRGRSVRWRLVRDMALAWVVTLPAAALLAGAVYAVSAP